MKSEKGTSHLDQVKRINRIEGQVRGIKKMIEEERYCIDILTQIKAIKSALVSVETNIIEEHLNHCVIKAIKSKSETKAMGTIGEIKELLRSSGR